MHSIVCAPQGRDSIAGGATPGSVPTPESSPVRAKDDCHEVTKLLTPFQG